MVRTVDKANGFIFGDGAERNIQAMLSCAMGAEFEYEKIKDIREKYMDTETDMNEESDQVNEQPDQVKEEHIDDGQLGT